MGFWEKFLLTIQILTAATCLSTICLVLLAASSIKRTILLGRKKNKIPSRLIPMTKQAEEALGRLQRAFHRGPIGNPPPKNGSEDAVR